MVDVNIEQPNAHFALQVKNLSKVYDNQFRALNSLSLNVESGDFFALLGPNGAGKSTLIGILCSLIKKSQGEVSIFGHNIDTHFSLAKQQLGIVPQEFNFNLFEKLRDVVINQGGYYGIPRKIAAERADKYLSLLGLSDKSDQVIRHLSGGMKRRLMIARALVHEPKVLILDEPTAGVDIELRRSMWDFLTELNNAGTTIILTTHYLEEAERLCRNVAIIDRGNIVQNTSVKALLQQLNEETFIFDTKDPVKASFQVNEFSFEKIDDNSLKVPLVKGQTLNPVFQVLSQQGIDVVSMRTESSRLEELFLRLTNQPATS